MWQLNGNYNNYLISLIVNNYCNEIFDCNSCLHG